MNSIGVFTCLSRNTARFAEFMRKTMIALASGEHELSFNAIAHKRWTTCKAKGWSDAARSATSRHPSLNHAKSLNCIPSLCQAAGDICVICDVDTAVLTKDWDRILVEELRNDSKIVGATYEKKSDRYKGFPSILFMATRSDDLFALDPDFSPRLKTKEDGRLGCTAYYPQNETEAKWLGIEMGRKIRGETGWRLPLIFGEAGMRSTTFLYQPRPRFAKGVYHCWRYNGDPVVAHLSRSSQKGIRSKASQNWMNGIREYVKEKHSITLD